MREIKFRAWTGKEMFYDVERTLISGKIAFRDKSLKLMQYTGLKDKNGKEIYEGDIIRARYITGNIIVNEIKFKKGCFGPNGFYNWGDICELDVIGNIYENPELLKETKNGSN